MSQGSKSRIVVRRPINGTFRNDFLRRQAARRNTNRFLKGVTVTGLVAGALVAFGTTLKYVISGGNDPWRLLNFAASGLLGESALEGGSTMAAVGLALHLAVSLAWAFMFFSISPKTPFLAANWKLAGVVYGIAMWIVMTLVVLPLSKAPSIPLNIGDAASDILLIIVGAGLPISYLARHYRQRNGRSRHS